MTQPQSESLMNSPRGQSKNQDSDRGGPSRFNTQVDEIINESNQAAYALYRPEIRGMPMPKTYLEAKKKYNHGAQPQLADHQRHMKKLGITQKIVGYKKEGEFRNKSIGQDLNKYLGSRPLVKTSHV